MLGTAEKSSNTVDYMDLVESWVMRRAGCWDSGVKSLVMYGNANAESKG